MSKSFVQVVGVALGLALGLSNALGALGEPTTYVITIKKIELSKDGGATYTVIATGNRSFTIASSHSHGAIISDYVSGAEVEPGEYNAIRITLSSAIGLLGTIVQDNGLNNGSTFCTGTGIAPCTPSLVTVTLTNALVTAAGLTIPSGMTIDDVLLNEIIYVNTSFRLAVWNKAIPYLLIHHKPL